MAAYSLATKTFARGLKHLMGELAAGILLDERHGRVGIGVRDVKTAIDRISGADRYGDTLSRAAGAGMCDGSEESTPENACG